MKTKIVISVLVVLAVVVSNAAVAGVVYFDTADPLVLPGETISVSIFSTVETDSIRMDRISDADLGVASTLSVNPDYPEGSGFNIGNIVNSGGVLIEGVRAGLGLPVWSGVTGVLYSFDYLVPSASAGHTITIFPDPSNSAVNEIFCKVDDNLVYLTPDSLTLTIVPEPATILLLALGGFFVNART